MNWQTLVDWFLSLGHKYNVNPIVFGGIYVGAIPFFTASVAWIIRNFRSGKSILLPTFLAGFFFISAYLYLIVVGRNVPVWVYGFVAVLVVFGGWSTVKKVKGQIREDGP
ncbi:MAG: hypothetical protein ACE5IY_16125 [bacterium]